MTDVSLSYQGATARLSRAVAEVAPVHGVSVGRWSDRETWRIDFRDEATDAERAAALAVMAAFDPLAGGNASSFEYRSVFHPDGYVAYEEPDERPAPLPVLAYEGLAPDAWTTLGEAQAALRGWVLQEHARRTAARQTHLDEISRLSVLERDASQETELRQHIEWGRMLRLFDEVRETKFTAIAALASLVEARAWALTVGDGWGA